MRFLANENFPLPCRLLREAGHDVVSITKKLTTDSQVLSRAVSEQRIILTLIVMIHRLQLPHSPVVFLRYDPLSPEETAHHILRLCASPNLSAELIYCS